MEFLYQDKYVVVCQKEPGLLSEHTPNGDGLPDLIAKELGIAPDDVYVVHRLDRTTGGLMVFARDKKTAAHLSAEIQAGRFTKEYLTLCEGETISETMVDQLYFDRGRNQSFVVKKRPGAKEAVLHNTVLAVLDSPYPEVDKVSLCRVKLDTGRTHQIRVQFASRKHPLVGDRKYGAKCHTKDCTLWSAHLAFTHPNGKMLDFTLDVDTLFPQLGDKLPRIDWNKNE